MDYSLDDVMGLEVDPTQAQVDALRKKPRVSTTSLSSKPRVAPVGSPLPVEQQRSMGRYAALDTARDKLNSEMDALDTPADYSAIQSRVAERQGQAKGSLAMALAAQYAGKQGAPFQAHYLKQAAEQQQPFRVEGGEVDASGVVIDPGYRRQQQMSTLQRRAARLDSLEQGMVNADQRAQIAREKMENDRQMRQMMIESREGIAAAGREARAGAGGAGHNLTQIEDPATGQMFWADPRTGNPVKPVTAPGGADIVKPEKLPTAATTEIQQLVQSRAAVDTALAAVKSAPSAFTAAKGAVDYVPGVAGQMAMSARDRRLTDSELQARNQVYNNVSKIIVERAGLAQTAQEQKRLNSFLPSPTDGPREIEVKLQAFRDFTDNQEKSVRANATRRAQPAPGNAPAATTDAEKEARYQAWKAGQK